jgi:flagellum-specific peptidoglycan hydrolase FlgJ
MIPNDIIAAAQSAMKTTGVPASVTLAQWIVESDSGKHVPEGSNNPFGIKAVEGQPFVASPTREFIAGRWIRTTARFRKFLNLTDAFVSHGFLISRGRPYRGIVQYLHDPERLAHALTGIYATDPHYGDTLVKTMNDEGLWKYDRL